MCGYTCSVISLQVLDKMAINFDASLRNNPKVACGEKINLCLFQSRVNRQVCDVINILLNVILSYLLVM